MRAYLAACFIALVVPGMSFGSGLVDKLDDGARLLTLTGVKVEAGEVAERKAQEMAEAIKTQFTGVSASDYESIYQSVRSIYLSGDKNRADFNKVIQDALLKNFSAAEIKQMLNFYSSPVGIKSLAFIRQTESLNANYDAKLVKKLEPSATKVVNDLVSSSGLLIRE